MADFTDFSFASSTGKNTIRARKIVPDGEVKAVVQIAHGIAEHIERYDDFMRFLADNGCVVVGNDHLGHGKSAKTEKEKGAFASKDGWNAVVKDMVKLHDIMIQEYPGVKYVMFGHSMGSFLTRTYLIDYPGKYDAAIISGTGHQSPALIIGGNLIADLLIKMNGYMSDGQKLNDIAFGSYLSKIENPRTPFDWLTKEDSVVDRYIEDPMCGFVAKTGLYGDMMKGIKYITSEKNMDRMDKTKPVYFMSGKDDPVGDYGKGVEKAYDCFKKVKMQDVMIRLYDEGRHEMLNETNKEKVYEDILNWLKEKVF